MRIGRKNLSAPNRRRFLQLSAATSAAALCPIPGAFAAPQTHVWQGSALGADATITLGGLEANEAEELFKECLSEISRLEAQFSLYREDSALMRLNRDGVLEGPTTEFIELLDVSKQISAATSGAFDPSVQPLWQLYASGGGAEELATAKTLVDFRNVNWSAQRVAFARDGMAMTLNGIAQGFITDRIADHLRSKGLTSVLVNLGEYRAIGAHPALRPWQVGIQDPKIADGLIEIVELQDEAVATSGAYGGLLGPDGQANHLFDPRSGKSAELHSSVSVVHPRATIADGLSTAFSFLSEEEIQTALSAFEGARVLIVRPDGTLAKI
ncbi:MAG: FAD:protein FMN transferase [Micropepsaceae bacterium]